jgi:hypothetical protein
LAEDYFRSVFVSYNELY